MFEQMQKIFPSVCLYVCLFDMINNYREQCEWGRGEPLMQIDSKNKFIRIVILFTFDFEVLESKNLF